MPQLSFNANRSLIAIEPVRVDSYKETTAHGVRVARFRFREYTRTIPLTLVMPASTVATIAGRDVDDPALLKSARRAYKTNRATVLEHLTKKEMKRGSRQQPGKLVIWELELAPQPADDPDEPHTPEATSSHEQPFRVVKRLRDKPTLRAPETPAAVRSSILLECSPPPTLPYT